MVEGIGGVGGPGGIDPTGPYRKAGAPAAGAGRPVRADRADLSSTAKALGRVANARFLQGASPERLARIAEAVEIVRRAPDVREEKVATARRRLASGELTADRSIGPIADGIPGPIVVRSR